MLALLQIQVTLYSQNTLVVNGTITDTYGEIIPGVSVTVKGSKAGAISDIKGNYSLPLSNSNSTLVFSFLGYISQELAVNNRNRIDVVMVENIHEMEEFVVIGYGSVRKSDLTGSVSSLGSRDLAKSGASDFMNAMQGRLAGVSVTSLSGEPGAAINILIRGANSINGSSTPLYVIDGVQLDINANEVAMPSGETNRSQMNPLSSINPADIESIEILKDASATAIFGSRGANGVVIVTTKSGKSGARASLEYVGRMNSSSPSKKIKLLSPYEYLDYQEYVGNVGLMYRDEDGDGVYETRRDFSLVPSHNWQDELLRTGITHDHTLTASGSSDKSNYSASLSYIDQEAILLNNNYQRYNFRINLNHKQSDKLTVGFNILPSYQTINGVATDGGGSAGNGSVQYILISNPWEIMDPQDETVVNDKYVSPMALIDNGEKTTSLLRVIGSSYIDYAFRKNLRLNVSLNGNISKSKMKEFYGNDTPYGNGVNGYANVREVTSKSYTQTTRLNYNTRIGKDRRFDALAAWEVNQYDFEDFYNSIQNFVDQSTGVDNIGKGSVFKTISTNHTDEKRLSFLSRINYSYKDKYLLTASFRADGSDKFGVNSRWGYFPSAALAYRVSQEKFLKNSDLISNLKLRLSFGATGNDRISPYSYIATMTDAAMYYASNNTELFGMGPNGLANPDLKWETTLQYDAGIDLGLFKNRISIGVDAYLKKTKDMLMYAAVAGQSGFANQWKNIGSVENKGLEIAISTQNIITKNFSWETNFNINFNKNKVIDLGGAEFQTVRASGSLTGDIGRLIPGEAIGVMWGYQWDGIYQIDDFTWQNNSDPSIPHAQRNYVLKPGVVSIGFENAQPGKHKFKDLSGPEGVPDGVVDASYDRTIIGQSAPKHWGGISNSFRYKSFDMSVSLNWSYGQQIYNDGKLRITGFGGYYNITKEYFDNYWMPDRPSNQWASALNGYAVSRFATSYYVEDASFLRIQDIQLGYTLPKSLLKGTGISNLRVYVAGSNLHVFTNYSGFDPEVAAIDPLLRGVDRISYPRARTFSFGINFKL